MNRRRFLRCGLGAIALAQAAPVVVAPIGAADGNAFHAKLRTSLAANSLRPPVFDRPGLEAAIGRVVVARDLLPPGRMLISNRDPLEGDRVRARLDAGMTALLGPEGWRALFDPQDTVAIKINGLAAPFLSSRPEVVSAICEALIRAGIAPGRLIIWDRTTREVERSGFHPQLAPDAIRVYGTDGLRGGGYSPEIFACGAVGGQVSRIVSQYATALVNVGVLKDHDLAGLSAGLKNLYGVIHNPNRYHADGCDPFVAEVAGLQPVRSRLRLTVLDAALAQSEGGPAYSPDWIWPADRLILGIDPVACDSVAWRILEEERARRGLPSLAEAERQPDWIRTAAVLGLGRQEPAVIDV